MLREIPESEMEGESYERWLFEIRRKEWEAEQQQEDKEEGLPERYF